MMTSAEYARDVRLFGIGPLFADRFRDLQTQLREGHLGIRSQRARRDMLAQGTAVVALYGTLAGMAFYSVQGGMTLGVIVMYFQGYQRALAALQNILQGLAWLYEDNLFLKHFYAFLDLPSHVEQSSGESLVPEATELGLVCQNLHFTYPSRKQPVLRGIDFELHPGEIVALVGVNGSGKTTLAKLICRLYDPEEGTVSWEGKDLKQFTAQAWRRQVSVVCQDFARFDLSIAENIWLGDIERASGDDELLAAARIAGSEVVVQQFPDGLQTALGTQYEKGQELSVGEWQRIALSRAYFRQAQLLILDEPSSALDPLAEAEMIRSFREVIGKRSALIISHRLSTVQLADRIYVLDDGQVVEQGTHQELLQRDGHYTKLYSSQAAHYRN
jgi:ATP-binding cassette subfamily B protein